MGCPGLSPEDAAAIAAVSEPQVKATAQGDADLALALQLQEQVGGGALASERCDSVWGGWVGLGDCVGGVGVFQPAPSLYALLSLTQACVHRRSLKSAEHESGSSNSSSSSSNNNSSSSNSSLPTGV